ncbi:MAG: hypothetical protein AAFO63_01375 [Pseudomonadota bacterium]
MTNKDETIARGVETALRCAETKRWVDLSLAEIAEAAGLSLKDFHQIADKADLAAAVDPFFDAAMSEASLDEDETARTRLFDVLMMRFEEMEARRDGTLSFLRWRDRTVPGLALRAKARLQTARWALTCAGLDGGGGNLPRQAQLLGLAWAISRAEKAWKSETSADLSSTMAALDAELLKAESRIDLLKQRGRRRKNAKAETGEQNAEPV